MAVVKELNGIICVNKPAGFTSFDVIAKMRGILKMRRLGHGGTLDPMATGVLPVFAGSAAKASEMLPDHDKEYEAGFQLGIVTDTQDCTGKVLSESEWPSLMEVTDETILKEFFLLDHANENYKEMIVMQCPISAVMSEIIIINADDVSAAQADLEARKTKAIEQDAWYPNDQELAAASIVGTNGNYAYYIIGQNASAAEQSINDYISSLS